MTNNQINDNLIEIIQLSLTIFDLWSHSHLWVVGWVDGHFDIYLNHLSPLQGYFLQRPPEIITFHISSHSQRCPFQMG